jgi:mevalonate kinase
MKLRITQHNEGQHFYGHGKLLLTGEYFVLDGARALAVPTKLGQKLRVKELTSSDNTLYWVALNSKKQIWLNLVFDKAELNCLNDNSPEAARLSSILSAARKLNPEFLKGSKDLAVETQLEFPNEWGLGSSSTLIYALSQWAGVDGYELLKATIGGSGYDVACAGYDNPVLYQLKNGVPETLEINWRPAFEEDLYFAYLGKKQLSSEGIKYYREKLNDKAHVAGQLSLITEQVMNCNQLATFEALLNEHEEIVGSALKMMKVKDTHFQDYWGSMKSLGAWGGDFVLLTNERSREELTDYLNAKGIYTIFRFDEMVFHP